MEIKDNREIFAQTRAEKIQNAPVCRVCGSKEIHSAAYEKPTMKCVNFLRSRITDLERSLDWHR